MKIKRYDNENQQFYNMELKIYNKTRCGKLKIIGFTMKNKGFIGTCEESIENHWFYNIKQRIYMKM